MIQQFKRQDRPRVDLRRGSNTRMASGAVGSGLAGRCPLPPHIVGYRAIPGQRSTGMPEVEFRRALNPVDLGHEGQPGSAPGRSRPRSPAKGGPSAQTILRPGAWEPPDSYEKGEDPAPAEAGARAALG